MARYAPVKEFGLTLSAIREIMEEFKFSKEEAMAELRKRLPPGKQPVAVQKSLRRLEACPDEPTLYHLLGKESLRALDLLKFQRRR